MPRPAQPSTQLGALRGSVFFAGKRHDAVDGVGELRVRQRKHQHEDHDKVDKEHGVGGRPAIGDPQHLRSDPGHTGKQHVRQKGKVEEADAFPAPGGNDPQPQEVRRAADKQCGEEVREDS